MTKQITDKGQNVLNAIALGHHARGDIASYLNVSAPSVNGAINGLSRNGLVDIHESGDVFLTADAAEFVTVKVGSRGPRAPRTGTKMEQARGVFAQYASKGRQTVLAQFAKLGLTKAGASTYYQTLRHEAEMAQAAGNNRKGALRKAK